MELEYPHLACEGCKQYADAREAGAQLPCVGCVIYYTPKLHPLTRWAINLYWLAFGDEAARERYRATPIRLPQWKASYVFACWEIYSKLIREARERRADVPEGTQGVNTELPEGFLEERGEYGPGRFRS